METNQCSYHYGERLRSLISQPYVTAHELKSLLRKRGIFLGDATKDQMIPILTGGLLLPCELNSLFDLAEDRETDPKRRTSMVECADQRDLVHLIGAEVDVAGLVNTEYRNFEILDVTPVRAIDGNPNELELEYSIRRNDMSQNWTQSVKTFRARLIAKKAGKIVKFVSIHSSTETD